ncbi:hypothetical protein HUJ04_006371 [Dendroctonus ponderosae]|nr:hypothetical protein HUJ04_006371 [Dendroctonus ponderosae]
MYWDTKVEKLKFYNFEKITFISQPFPIDNPVPGKLARHEHICNLRIASRENSLHDVEHAIFKLLKDLVSHQKMQLSVPYVL